MKKTGYHVIDFPVTRLSTADVGRFGLKKHYMFGLLEVDVTDARRRLRELRRSGEEASFTAWMIKTIGDCAARNPLVHAVRWRRRRLVSFDDVDIAIAVDRVVEGQSVPLPLLIRRTNSRSARDIDREIRDALSRPIAGERDFVLGRHSFSRAGLWMYYRLPQALRLVLWRALFSDPFRANRHSGTIMVTTVNAVGGTAGWILPSRNMHNLALSFGSIVKKPWILDGAVTPRDILHLTVTFNHDVIDGVPARAFVQELVRRVESFGRDAP